MHVHEREVRRVRELAVDRGQRRDLVEEILLVTSPGFDAILMRASVRLRWSRAT
jgi:hypothetical protein